MKIDVKEAQSRLSQLVDEVSPGEELTVLKQGRAVAKLVRLELDNVPKKSLLGSGEGDFVVPENFDDPLPKEIEDSFYK